MKRLREAEEASVNGNGSDDDDGPTQKVIGLDGSGGTSTLELEFRCSLPPHKKMVFFSTYREYEAHYNLAHSNRCQDCRKNFPSAYLLELHLEECHDSLTAVKRDRGDRTFSCFVETCDKKCLTPQKRRMHLIDKHQYPKNYFFSVTRDGIDGRQSLLLLENRDRRKPKSGSEKNQFRSPDGTTDEGPFKLKEEFPKPETSTVQDGHAADKEDPPAVEMEDLDKAMSALQFVPSSIRFGRGGKAGFPKGKSVKHAE